MGVYNISILDGQRKRLRNFRVGIAYEGAPKNWAFPRTDVSTTGPTPVIADAKKYPGGGRLYITGPAAPNTGENTINYSHFEVIHMSGSGDITFVFEPCPETDLVADRDPLFPAGVKTLDDLKKAGKSEAQKILEQSLKDKPGSVTVDSELFVPNELSKDEPLTIDNLTVSKNKKTYAGEIVLHCTTITLTVRGNALPQDKHIFQLRHHGMTFLTNAINVAAGDTKKLRVPSGRGAYLCHIWKADAKGDPIIATLYVENITLRVIHPIGVHILVGPGVISVTPPKPPQPKRYEKRVEIGNSIAISPGVEVLSHIEFQDRPHKAQTPTSRTARRVNAAVLKRAWQWLDDNHKDAIHQRVLAFYDETKDTYFLASDRGAWRWSSFKWSPKLMLDGSLLRHDMKITHVLVEWVK